MDENLFENEIKNMDLLLREWDDTIMQLPSVESEPHLLISKVRKHYLEYVIQLLSINYENSQKLLGKNIYLPSAIWRCANTIEMNAARASMVVDLYRKNLTTMIKELKTDTKRGRLNKKLLNCLRTPPANEKIVQVTLDNATNRSNHCTCNGINGLTNKKRRKLSSPANKTEDTKEKNQKQFCENVFNSLTITETGQNTHQIPVVLSSRNNQTQSIPTPCTNIEASISNACQKVQTNQSSEIVSLPRMSIESQDSEDQVMLQLEQLFRADYNELEDDLFEGTLYDDALNTSSLDVQENKSLEVLLETNNTLQLNAVDEQAAKIKSLNERLTMLETSGILNANTNNNVEPQKNMVEPSKQNKLPQKWLCEHYFQKLHLFERMDDIRDLNRKKHLRIKLKFIELFGEDSDDEENVMSPLEETTGFVFSCKERIAPWIVKMLTPYYVKGRIRGKALFKSLAKHLIRIIYQCSKYPSEFEVNSFVSDFLKSHKMIRCEGDYKEFRIENI